MSIPSATVAPTAPRPASRPRWRMRAACVLAAPLLLCATAAMQAQPARASIPLVKAVEATYLYKLAPFVQWPAMAFATPTSPVVICVLGTDPINAYLTRAVADQHLGMHPFAVRAVAALDRNSGCHIVFISGLRDTALRGALAAVAGEPVLTVTDAASDPAAPSIIRFVIDQGHVRFDVNLEAAARNHLSISSKLLSLAVAVRH